MGVQKEGQTKDIVLRILGEIRRNFILIMVVTLLGFGVGVLISRLRESEYTASLKVIYKTEAIGEEGYSNVTITRSYLPTVLDFCDEGCVAERANFYYRRYAFSGLKIDEFIREIDAGNVEYPDTNPYGNDDIKITGIGASSASGGTNSFAIIITYSDIGRKPASDKVKLVTRAIYYEINSKVDPNDPNSNSKYLGNVSVVFYDITGTPNVFSTVNHKNLLIWCTVAGLAASLGIIYLLNMASKAITTKEELERISGVGLLAYIADQDGGK